MFLLELCNKNKSSVLEQISVDPRAQQMTASLGFAGDQQKEF